ncbi:MAG: hypothetical protein GW917_00525 [Bdellovibrionales bacterium]|nr:hypothetical protein [Bdellovibrionales bacterium]
MLIFSTGASAAKQSYDCASLLAIPSQHASAFDKYVNPEHLTPLPYVTWGGSRFFNWTLTLSNEPADFEESDEEFKVDVSAEGVFNQTEDGRFVLHLEDVEISVELDPEYAYRVLMAHLLDRYPVVDQIRYFLEDVPDYGMLRGLLSMGTSLELAMSQLPYVKALEDFGYQLNFKESESKILDPYSRDHFYDGALQVKIVVEGQRPIK